MKLTTFLQSLAILFLSLLLTNQFAYGQKKIKTGSDCLPDLHLSGNISSGVYSAAELLSSDGWVNPNATVEFYGGDRIQLQNDFSVPQSSTFNAKNIRCEVNAIVADVINVAVSGSTNNYTFNVTIESPDTGCQQYANWWEVISLSGQLIYRRVLGHSHITEQPFTRSGGPVNIAANETIIVRAWMHPTGYGGEAWQGNVTNGFTSISLSADFAAGLSTQPPLPTSCPF